LLDRFPSPFTSVDILLDRFPSPFTSVDILLDRFPSPFTSVDAHVWSRVLSKALRGNSRTEARLFDRTPQSRALIPQPPMVEAADGRP
jgi:hypothetical protein